LRDYGVNLSEFEERSMIAQSDGVLNSVYRRSEDDFVIVVNPISLSEWVEKSQLENEIENLINVRHPCIAGPIGFVFPVESVLSRELKIIRLYMEFGSLAEMMSMDPEWWTSTAKAKAVVGIVPVLRFLHSLGLVHDRLNSRNIFFDAGHQIQIADFGSIHLDVDQSAVRGFSGRGWTPQTDVRAFASILSEIVIGGPANGEAFVPTEVPEFVSTIIKKGLSPESEIPLSFNDLFEILKSNNFQIVEWLIQLRF
jgi:serine/threonine protein kinase